MTSEVAIYYLNLMQFLYPLEKFYVTQKYGNKSSMYASGYHMGMDLRASFRTPVFAAQAGTIVVAKTTAPFNGYGCHVAIDHGQGYFTVYGHLDEARQKVGDKVAQGQCIGYSGGNPRDYGAKGTRMKVNGQFTKAGASTALHLHFEIDRNDVGPQYCTNPVPLTTFDPNINRKYILSLKFKAMAQQISDFAKPAAERMKATGLSNCERPKDNITREEVWTMFDRMMNWVDNLYAKKAK